MSVGGTIRLRKKKSRGLTSSLAGLRFHVLGCGKLPVPVRLGARGTRMQFTNFPDRCTTSVTRHG